MTEVLYRTCKCVCPCCCLIHPDIYKGEATDSLLEGLLDEGLEEPGQLDVKVERIKTNRKFELTLVFKHGRKDETYSSLGDSRKRDLFRYLGRKEAAPNEASVSKKTNEKDNVAFARIIDETITVLRRQGFLVKPLQAADLPSDVLSRTQGKIYFVEVGMTEAEYRRWAAEIGFLLEMDPICGLEWLRMNGNKLAQATTAEDTDEGRLLNFGKWEHIYVPYHRETPQQVYKTRTRLWEDDPQLGDYPLFRSADKCKLLLSKLKAPVETGGVGMDLDGLAFLSETNVHPLQCWFPNHVEEENEEWYTALKASYFELPVDKIREYHGEYIAIYFAFIQYFNYALLIPTVLGIFVFLLQCSDSRINDRWSVFLSLLIVFWGQITIEGWRYREYFLQKKWGQSQIDNSPEIRPDFDGEWVYSNIDGSLVPYFDPMIYYARICYSYAVIAFAITCLLLNLVALIFLQRAVNHLDPTGEGVAPAFGIFSAILIIIFDLIYTNVAIYLNQRENHRTEAEYEKYLIGKMFVFRFLNSYNALFYIAFFKYYFDDCGGTKEDGCFDELRWSLCTIFGTQLVVGNIQEAILPKLLRFDICDNFCTNYFCPRKDDYAEGLDDIYDSYKLPDYDGTFEDFNEIILNFGYCTIFVVAFPLAALLCLVSNLVEIRVDAMKFHSDVRRVRPRNAATIEPWFSILRIMGWISTVCNLAIILVLFRTFEVFVGLGHLQIKSLLILLVLMEHVIAFTFLVWIPNWNAMPESIKKHYARQEHISAALKRIAENMRGEFRNWNYWSRTEFRRFLQTEGRKRRERAIERLSDVDGQALVNMKNVKKELKETYLLSNREAKWAGGLIRDLTETKTQTKDRKKTFENMLALRNLAWQRKRKVPRSASSHAIIYASFDFWKFGSFITSMNGAVSKLAWDAILKNRNRLRRFRAKEQLDKALAYLERREEEQASGLARLGTSEQPDHDRAHQRHKDSASPDFWCGHLHDLLRELGPPFEDRVAKCLMDSGTTFGDLESFGAEEYEELNIEPRHEELLEEFVEKHRDEFPRLTSFHSHPLEFDDSEVREFVAGMGEPFKDVAKFCKLNKINGKMLQNLVGSRDKAYQSLWRIELSDGEDSTTTANSCIRRGNFERRIRDLFLVYSLDVASGLEDIFSCLLPLYFTTEHPNQSFRSDDDELQMLVQKLARAVRELNVLQEEWGDPDTDDYRIKKDDLTKIGRFVQEADLNGVQGDVSDESGYNLSDIENDERIQDEDQITPQG